jgi:hypothetical protein
MIRGRTLSIDNVQAVLDRSGQRHPWCCKICVTAQSGSYGGQGMSFLKY